MVACSKQNSARYTTKNIVSGHAYTFLNATYLEYKMTRVKLVQLRNPWGYSYFDGDWCNHDEKWDYVTP